MKLFFLTLLPPLSTTTFRNVRMEECRKPEWATIQPLTRGTGNHDGSIVSSGISSGGKPIEIHVHNEVKRRRDSENYEESSIKIYWIANIK